MVDIGRYTSGFRENEGISRINLKREKRERRKVAIVFLNSRHVASKMTKIVHGEIRRIYETRRKIIMKMERDIGQKVI